MIKCTSNYTFIRLIWSSTCFQIKSNIHRSLDLESFKIQVTPNSSKVSRPTIIKLYPPTAKPLHMHANMPMRFGRGNIPGDDQTPNSTPNMPQRFGRSWKVTLCAECSGIPDVPKQPHRLVRNSQYWSLLLGYWTLACTGKQLLSNYY